MKTKEDFFKRQAQYKDWFLNDKKNCKYNDVHQIEFKYFTENIAYASYNKTHGDWTTIDYQEHMIKIAKQVLISPDHIDEMQQKLDFDKKNLGVV